MPSWIKLDEFCSFVELFKTTCEQMKSVAEKIEDLEEALTEHERKCSRKFEDLTKTHTEREKRPTETIDPPDLNSGGSQINQDSQGVTTTKDTRPSDFEPIKNGRRRKRRVKSDETDDETSSSDYTSDSD